MSENKSPAADVKDVERSSGSGPVGFLSRLPGVGMVTRVAGGALDTIGAVSPRGRRIAVYTGAGVLGVAGLVEWPVALTGAAVAWLTRPARENGDGRDRRDGHGAGRTPRNSPRYSPRSLAAGDGPARGTETQWSVNPHPGYVPNWNSSLTGDGPPVPAAADDPEQPPHA
ncbi:hypothetical protein [Streptomyces sp. NPDC059786]|uniref:hypothetical protein n=1 Tax=Streptomyces sp. NPDC059786 TaxID=3346946 RepID=UPI00364F179E